MARKMRSTRSGSPRSSGPHPSVPSEQKGIFRKEGEYWTVGLGGKAFRLKDTKGVAYLAHLLRYPTAEFHVLDLVAGIADRTGEGDSNRLPRGDEELEKAGIHIGSLGDAGELLDDQAKSAYRRRLSELREELEEAKRLGKIERAEQLEDEIGALNKELSRAIGLGGRNRRAAAASERARQSVTKTLKAVVERIAQGDAVLGGILSRSIRTGNFCSCRPDPNFPIAWEFGATDAGPTFEPAVQPVASGVPAPARADGPEALPLVLEVSPFSLAQRTAFVGRESEGGAIRALIDRALTGDGSIVMLWDGPGVGKSRLAMEMAEYASRKGFLCSVGRCYERDEPFPYLPFVEIIENNLARAASLDDYRRRMGDTLAELAQIAPSLRRMFRDIPQPLELPPAQQRRYLFQNFSEALARVARRRPHLLVLEDLHWADESTLALLIYLANRIAQLPLVILGTYRSGYSDDNPALVRTLEELLQMGIRPQKLGGLSKDAIAQMLDGLSQRQAPESLVNLIFEESQGYPFFVEEVYRHLIEEGRVFDAAGQFRKDIRIDEIDVPDNVRLIISRRLERLDENEKRVLAAAAVIGRSFSFQLLTAISQIDVDELFTVIETAQQMGIIVPSSEGPEKPFTFAHELVRQTLLVGISAPRQQLLHAGVADAMERVNPGAVNEHAAEMAHHLLKAGSFVDGQRVVRWLTLAGKAALEAAAFEEARQSFRSALSHQGVVDLGERADLLTSLATAERGLEQWEVVLASLNEALEIYINLGDRQRIGKSFTELTEALSWAGRFQEATEAARRGLAYLDGDVSAERVRLLAALGESVVPAAATYEPAVEALNEALDIASRLSDPKLEASVLGARSMVNLIFFRLREAAADGLRSEQIRGSELSPWQRARQLFGLFNSLYYLGRKEEAVRIGDELESLARKIGQFHSVARYEKVWQFHSVARYLCEKVWREFGEVPDLAKLETALKRVLISDQRLRVEFLDALSEIQLSLLDFLRGNWPDALVHAQASCRSPLISIQGYGVGTLFLQLAYAGDREAALALFDEKRAWLPRVGRYNITGSWDMLINVIEGLVVLGEQSQAAQLYPLVLELVDTGTLAFSPRCRLTQTIAGLAAGAAHQWEAAEDHFRVALQQAVSFPSRLEQAEVRRFHAMMLLNRAAPGDRKKAQKLLREALETYSYIGMPRHSEITQNLLV